MEWGPQDLIPQDSLGHLGWPYKRIRVPGVHLRLDSYQSAPVMSPCRRKHWDGKGQRSQSHWRLADVFSFIHTVLWKFTNFIQKARFPVSFAKAEDLARQAWVPATKALRGHLLPHEWGSPFAHTPVPTTPFHQLFKHRCRAGALDLAGRMMVRPGLIKQPQLTFPFKPHSYTPGVMPASIAPVLWWHLPLCTRVPLFLCPSTSWLSLHPLNSETHSELVFPWQVKALSPPSIPEALREKEHFIYFSQLLFLPKWVGSTVGTQQEWCSWGEESDGELEEDWGGGQDFSSFSLVGPVPRPWKAMEDRAIGYRQGSH